MLYQRKWLNLEKKTKVVDNTKTKSIQGSLM